MDLHTIAANHDQKLRTEEYKSAFQRILQHPAQSDCVAFIDHIVSTDVPLVVSRPVLASVIAELANLPGEMQETVSTHALRKMQGREVAFEDQLDALRELCATLCEKGQDWSGAAQMLAAIDLERGSRALADKQKLERYVKITMLYLEDDDAVNAERFFVKANPYIASCDDTELELKYKACYARISDSKRRFLEAAMRYYELSQAPVAQCASPACAGSQGIEIVGIIVPRDLSLHILSEESVRELLQAAATCAILHPAGTHRSRMLSMLYKDERVSSAGAVPQFSFLEKMLMERLITKEEVVAFDNMLRDHQRARLPDGFTVLERAVMQHNILSVSKMYLNISLSELSALLGVPEEKTEGLVCVMMGEGRLQGYIDQANNMVHFDDDLGHLSSWDEQILHTCEAAGSLVEVIAAANVHG